MSYAAFLASKARIYAGDGLTSKVTLPPALYDWQAAIVRWALKKGRCAIWADCGLGKSFMQIAWAQLPLGAPADQTSQEPRSDIQAAEARGATPMMVFGVDPGTIQSALVVVA